MKSSAFDSERYNNPTQYCVRVYLLRGLQLVSTGGKAKSCDPYVTCEIQSSTGNEKKQTKIQEGTLFPKFYQCFDFDRVSLPAIGSSLKISVQNDASIFGKSLIGTTEISLEPRIFSRQWQIARRPVERRRLLLPERGQIPMGFIEVCVDIIPQHLSGDRPLDYLLNVRCLPES